MGWAKGDKTRKNPVTMRLTDLEKEMLEYIRYQEGYSSNNEVFYILLRKYFESKYKLGDLENYATIWLGLQNILAVPEDEGDRKKLIALRDRLNRKIDGTERHPLLRLKRVVERLLK